MATANASGGAAVFSATADTSLTSGGLVQFVQAATNGTVEGSATGEARAAIGGAMSTFVSGVQGVAMETATPAASATRSVMNANSNIKAAFGSSPVVFTLGELGGGYSSGGRRQTKRPPAK